MNVYIFDYVENLTSHYHGGGGLVVVADDDALARRLIARELRGETDDGEQRGVSEEEWADVKRYPLAEAADPTVFIFPDAGCC